MYFNNKLRQTRRILRQGELLTALITNRKHVIRGHVNKKKKLKIHWKFYLVYSH